MKKIYILALVIFSVFTAMAQPCIPDATLTTPGLKPKKLPDGIVGVPFSETVTLKVPLDTTVLYSGQLYPIKVDSASVVSISDLPTGYSYICDKPSRTWNGGALGCAKFTGTPTVSNIGSYQIYVKVRTFFKIVGIATQFDQLDSSTIDYKVVMSNAIQEFEQTAGMKVYPNPAQNQLNVLVNKYSSAAKYQIIDILGKTINAEPSYFPNSSEVRFDITNLEPGVYFVKGENEGLVYQVRFVKE